MTKHNHQSEGSSFRVDDLLAQIKSLEAKSKIEAKEYALQILKLEADARPLRTKKQAFDASLKHQAEVEKENADLTALNADLLQEIEELKTQAAARPAPNSDADSKNAAQTHLDRVKKELEGLKKRNVTLKDEKRDLRSKLNNANLEVKKRNEEIDKLRMKIMMTITDIDLSLLDKLVCICNGPDHERMQVDFNPFLICMDLFTTARNGKDRAWIDMYDEYRKQLIEHHTNDHSHLPVHCAAHEDNHKSRDFVTGDELREYFSAMDVFRNSSLDYGRKFLGVDLGTVGNY